MPRTRTSNMRGKKGGRATRGKQGFAAMSPADRSRIAAMGGREAQRRGTAHRWNSQEAAAAGRIGGLR